MTYSIALILEFFGSGFSVPVDSRFYLNISETMGARLDTQKHLNSVPLTAG